MNGYKKVKIITYVKRGIENGTMIPRQAEKFARITAKQGSVGDTVISWSVDSQGNEIKEKIAQIQIDFETNQPGWIATKVDEQGNIIIDNNGHLNQWIISNSTFKMKYEIDASNPNLFKPKGGPQFFAQIPENIILEQRGSKIQVAAGGYINITNINNMYAISQRDFEDTYRFIDDIPKKGPKL